MKEIELIKILVHYIYILDNKYDDMFDYLYDLSIDDYENISNEQFVLNEKKIHLVVNHSFHDPILLLSQEIDLLSYQM